MYTFIHTHLAINQCRFTMGIHTQPNEAKNSPNSLKYRHYKANHHIVKDLFVAQHEDPEGF